VTAIDTTCQCAACVGLQSLERARFFAGQLLTESELNAQDAYVRAKNRLHNRYLHGTGVVCGLQVSCHECEGWVTVRPGYAIDPCGNDVVVCESVELDFIARVRACRERPERADCDPLAPPRRDLRRGVEETWCLTLAYDEHEVDPVAALRWEQTATPPSRCSCGGNGNGNGHGACGCGGARQASAGSWSMQAQAQRGSSLAPCEPARVRETYRLGVVQRDDTKAPAAPPPGTFQAELLACQEAATKVLDAAPKLSSLMTPEQAYQRMLSYRQSVAELLRGATIARCELMDQLAAISIPPPDGAAALYRTQLGKPLKALRTLVGTFALDCTCASLLPPCPGDPVEERLVLACVTVKDETILRICNGGERRQLLTFPSLAYWLSAMPLRDRGALFWGVLGDPSFSEQCCPTPAQPTEKQWVQPGTVGDALSRLIGRKVLSAAVEHFAEATVDLSGVVGEPIAAAREALTAEGVTPTALSADDWSDDEVVAAEQETPAFHPVAQPLVLRVRDGRVVAAAPADSPDALRDLVQDLSRRVAELEQARPG
jgi:hypothetical protein